MNTKFSIGVDIGGTNTDIGIVDANGRCIASSGFLTATYNDPELYVDHLVDTIRSMMKLHNVEIITGIGVGVPNGNYYTGCIDNAVNLNFKGRVCLRDLIKERFNTEVVITNDANAAAYGEMIYGGAKGMKHFIMITLGTGVGSGLVVDGKLVYGHDGYAGELGHAISFPDGRMCGCGRKGCLEQYTSATGIKKTYLELSNKKFEDHVNEIDSRVISELAIAGDVIAKKTYEMTGEILGLAIANAVTYTSPEAIFLMGGPVKAGAILLNPLKESFEKNLLFIYKDKVKVLTSQLNENEAAILGAAALTNS